MENDHLILMVVSIVAVVGIVSMVLATGTRNAAEPTFVLSADTNAIGQAKAYYYEGNNSTNMAGNAKLGYGITPQSYCGDTVCNERETCRTCEVDCGECQTTPVCGNGLVEGTEQCDTGPTNFDASTGIGLPIINPATGYGTMICTTNCALYTYPTKNTCTPSGGLDDLGWATKCCSERYVPNSIRLDANGVYVQTCT